MKNLLYGFSEFNLNFAIPNWKKSTQLFIKLNEEFIVNRIMTTFQTYKKYNRKSVQIRKNHSTQINTTILTKSVPKNVT